MQNFEPSREATQLPVIPNNTALATTANPIAHMDITEGTESVLADAGWRQRGGQQASLGRPRSGLLSLFYTPFL